jgi:hypothetical protein
MDSWWDLGEGVGFSGDKPELWRITCAFCGEKGNFALAYHGEKKKANSAKRLNFDLYQCRNCMGFVHVLWSADEFRSGLYNYKVLPWPLASKPESSENWPQGMRKFWVQAHDSLSRENWDAAAVMARSALQFVAREKGAVGPNLKAEINDLATKGVLHPLMQDWSHEVRELGNDSAHPEVPQAANSAPQTPLSVRTEEQQAQDAKDIVNFLDFLLFYLYDLPKRIEEYRKRNSPATQP